MHLNALMGEWSYTTVGTVLGDDMMNAPVSKMICTRIGTGMHCEDTRQDMPDDKEKICTKVCTSPWESMSRDMPSTQKIKQNMHQGRHQSMLVDDA